MLSSIHNELAAGPGSGQVQGPIRSGPPGDAAFGPTFDSRGAPPETSSERNVSGDAAGNGSADGRQTQETSEEDRPGFELLEEALFKVSMVKLLTAQDTTLLPNHRAIVSESGEVFSVVTRDYHLVSHRKAYDLGIEAFATAFGEEASEKLQIFNVRMPSTRAWVQIDLTADSQAFEPRPGDRWLPFLRVINSYNRTKALEFTLGLCRWICQNGMIFGSWSATFRNTHRCQVAELPKRLRETFDEERVGQGLPAFRSHLEQLVKLRVPSHSFVPGCLEILQLRPPADLQSDPRAKSWSKLGSHLEKLGSKYTNELGENAYALVNAASDYASHLEAPMMNAGRVHGLQARCGRWIEKIGDQGDACLLFEASSVSDAERLLAFAKSTEAARAEPVAVAA